VAPAAARRSCIICQHGYGLSYGGYAALWLGAVEPRYALAICAGKFTATTQKFISTLFRNALRNTIM